ncbi:BlaI/MecI/CopY family transcriptional regulator [Amycolatopsis rubida]|uniref:BlaI/MecI/CopY family transcriptional regulator n=1 Tax=Amycolatopsis rubida TaxID=112413 RepID=A0ABX0BTL3_9PSEU|nr:MULTISPECIES: BlaI/MecI/CopY family transcriptional regulator [Amycolatopsis]MYW93886.1 BlaI/MecI/CopY family transcriptional regulator [Amycolatopsis rubida]NEC58875.1 BlaI/MecI/CopY family transcriptional regulator [Amycolatopsis rubida]
MQGLGELESAAMDVLWRAGDPRTVREVLEALNRDLAYTTVLTVLDHLHSKGWVEREKRSRAYCYTPVSSREEAAARAMRNLLADAGDPEGVLLHFARSASEPEREALRRGLRLRS